jgi:2-polyprenyl-3-methyl-5-hydroxy-6-metoxy-1,4-benzoquinol methylase
MSTLRDLRSALFHLRNGDVRTALVALDLPTRTAVAREKAEQMVRRTWMRYALRGVRQNDAHGRLDLAYKVPDPWHMASEQEQARFVETCTILRRELGARFNTVLEIGCGEGHQTEHLAELAGRITGIDVSPKAIERAARRMPEGEFLAGELFAQPWARALGHFDLVTACEVIYYMSDLAGFLRAMDRLGHHCLVTYFAPAARKVEAHVMAMPGVQQTTFRYRDVEWVAAWWKGEAAR